MQELGSSPSSDASGGGVNAPESGFIAYLRKTQDVKANLKKLPRVKIVLGNSACDLDSAASALSFAYFLQTEASRSLLCDTPILPMLNTNSNEIHIKTEVCYIFEKLGIPLELIIMRDHINLAELALENKLDLVLVDHHHLPPEDQVLVNTVMQVIDHRPVTRSLYVARAMCTIEEVGSCATLVARKITEREPSILAEDGPVPNLLYGAIILDTLNFSQITNRFKSEDVERATKLESVVLRAGATRLSRYNELMAARNNVSGLSTLDLLKKDLKFAAGNPVSTLTTLVQEFCQRPDAETSLHELLEHSELAILIGISPAGARLQRDVGFFTLNNQQICAKVEKALSSNTATLSLSLQKVDPPLYSWINIYKQKNLELTRKHILPVIVKTIEELKNASMFSLGSYDD